MTGQVVNRRMDMEYLTVKETAQKWGISGRRINTLCNEGRIAGAEKKGLMWLIPKDAEKPLI